ncbi:PadR family transcriptional regulator (plasmid) [Streptomyces sp. NBC_00853]|uniref:PadR family transcriptional regulator n=1 Tax=Streptomyces sp. NBC_00853 TaxID=2903681 RepID=UPI002F9125DD|nr:PadR family transcriptional regulator [Streptomyces sp. NBC_00853]
MTSIRMTRPTVDVLRVLLDASPEDLMWGTKICDLADLGSGTVFPILERLSTRGWITTRQEDGPHPGRPARTHYKLTEHGRTEARVALAARIVRLQRGGSGKTSMPITLPEGREVTETSLKDAALAHQESPAGWQAYDMAILDTPWTGSDVIPDA